MKVDRNMLVSESGNPIQFEKSPNYSAIVTPLYLVMHYTAGPDLDGAVSWFARRESNASAHIVIGRDGRIVQMVAFDKRAWHSGKSQWGELEGLNEYSIGIELANNGKLTKRDDGNWISWAKLVVPADEVTIATHKHENSATGWHEYPAQQISVALEVAICLNSTYRFRDVLGHEDVSPGRKCDPGPLFPMSNFRSRVLGRE